MTDKPTIQVEEERVQRAIDVLSLVSLGVYDADRTQIALEGREDAYARLEESLNVLTRELAETHQDNERHIAQLERTQRELEEKLAMIDRQQAAIRELSTPLIEIWDDILTLPVIGIVDNKRSVEMTARLLRRLAETRTRCVIIDITGVDVVDTMTANHFIGMVKSARLLGAYCVVSGISPEVAQTFVRMGVDLGQLRTLRSLKEALKDCFMYLRRTEEEAARSEGAASAALRSEG